MRKIFLLAALATALVDPVLAQDMSDMDMSGATNPAVKAYIKAMLGMDEAMKAMKPANDPDMDFIMMMKPHHEAAVEMAKAYLQYGTDPTLKRMAQDVIIGQTKEISAMTQWETEHSYR